jgi:hypothetical protein
MTLSDQVDSTMNIPLGATNGWRDTAVAICSILQIPSPMLLRLTPDDLPPLYVDFRFRAFEWPLPIDRFPTAPRYVDVETESTPVDSPPLFDLPGRNLDALLWTIGLNAFSGESASWLHPKERYKLRRWPNLTELEPTIDQMRMIAVLGTSSFSPTELATAAGVDVSTVRNLVNALSLMGLLHVTEDAPEFPEPTFPVTTTPSTETVEAPPSLFKRLRERLGL